MEELPKSIVASAEVVSCSLEDEAALLDLKSGSYFSLNDTGAFVWSILATPQSFESIRNSLSENYDVAPEVVEDDLRSLVFELRDQGLVTFEG